MITTRGELRERRAARLRGGQGDRRLHPLAQGGDPSGAQPGETDAAPGPDGRLPARQSRGRSRASPPSRLSLPRPRGRRRRLKVASRRRSSSTCRQGTWSLSLQYDATRPITVSADGFEQTLPGNLDFRGTGSVLAGRDHRRSAMTGRGHGHGRGSALGGPPARRPLGRSPRVAFAAVAPAGPGRDCDGYVDWYVR